MVAQPGGEEALPFASNKIVGKEIPGSYRPSSLNLHGNQASVRFHT